MFLTDGAQVIVRIHEPLVDDDPAAAGKLSGVKPEDYPALMEEAGKL